MKDFLSEERKEARKMFFKIKKALEKQSSKLKLVYIGQTQWGNEYTQTNQKINDLYILGKETGERPNIITEIALKDTNGIQTNYRLNEFLSHTNISGGVNETAIPLVIDDTAFIVSLWGQAFCNPITSYDVATGNEEDIRGLIRTNLLSQNYDDSFADINSVSNNGIDIAAKHMTRENSVIELLSGEYASTLNEIPSNNLEEVIKKINNIDKNQIWAKPKGESRYTLFTKTYYRNNREQFSDYYPAFDYEYIQKLNLEMPKEEYDLGVYGLGSAGTAVLDQLCRANWIESIYLCDFDTVEEKNLINQWYSKNYIGEYKTRAAESIIMGIERRNNEKIRHTFRIKRDNKKFEETDYKNKKFKYVISGFDSIKVRQKLFEAIQNSIIETQYLIDCRYLDLSSSIYIIDVHNKEQMDFYKANLDADAELLKEKEKILTEEEFYEWLDKEDPFKNCSRVKDLYFSNAASKYIENECYKCSCSRKDCQKAFYNAYLMDIEENKSRIKNENENTCIKQNYIDIYKYTGAIIFGALRKTENNQEKPFTLVEAQTDVNGLPNYMLVKA